jgi:hypothetical protein
MAVSLIDAQCAVACSERGIVPSHACCKHHKSPARESRTGQIPCSNPATAVDEARFEKIGAHTSLSAVILSMGQSVPLLLANIQWFEANPPHPPRPLASASNSILRI